MKHGVARRLHPDYPKPADVGVDLMTATQRHDLAPARREGSADRRAHVVREPPHPAKVRQCHPIRATELGAWPTTEPKPPFDDPSNARPPREIEEDDRVGALQPLGERARLHAFDDPRVAGDELPMKLRPALARGPVRASPILGVDVHDG